MSIGHLLLCKCLVHCRIPSGILGLHPLVASSTPNTCNHHNVCRPSPALDGDRSFKGELKCDLCFRSIPGFNGSEDCAALEQLLEGYDQQDQDQVSDVCNSPLFKYMDNDVSGPFGSTLLFLKRFSPCGLESFLPLYLYFSLCS